jgi:hypothetical protein
MGWHVGQDAPATCSARCSEVIVIRQQAIPRCSAALLPLPPNPAAIRTVVREVAEARALAPAGLSKRSNARCVARQTKIYTGGRANKGREGEGK